MTTTYLVSYECRRDGAIGVYAWETVSVNAENVRSAKDQALALIGKRLGLAAPGELDTRGCCCEPETNDD